MYIYSEAFTNFFRNQLCDYSQGYKSSRACPMTILINNLIFD